MKTKFKRLTALFLTLIIIVGTLSVLNLGIEASAAQFFTPRTTAPSHPCTGFYANAYNCCWNGNESNSGNCTWYAYGRACEIAGTWLSRSGWGDASSWYGKNYPTSQTPHLGDIACWGNGTYGHVAIVEGVNSNGTINISESSYSPSCWFRYRTNINPRSYTSGFQGYIHYGDYSAEPPHYCNFNQKNTNSKYLVSSANCTSAATYYYSCTCGAKGTSTFTSGSPLGHSYSKTNVAATCTKDAYVSCKCSRCGHTYTEAAATTYKYSDWSTTKPAATGNSTVETKTQYRYKDFQTRTETSKTDPSGWTYSGTSWKQTGSGTYYYFPKPNGFKASENMGYASSPISGYENSINKRTVSSAQHNSYIYWHWVSPMCYGVGTNCIIGEYETDYINSALGYTTVWEAFESASDLRWYTNSDGTVRVSDHSKYSYNWFISETYKQTYTDYQKVYTYTKAGDWTDWSDSKAPSSATDVQTRTVYRLKTPSSDTKALGHSWSNPVVTVQATTIAEGKETVHCTRCGATETHTIPKIKAMVTGITVSDIELKWHKTATLVYDVATKETVKYTVTYESSNPEIVSVDENGNVYGADSGSAVITCTATDEYGNTVTDTCTVTVKVSFFQWIIKILLDIISLF